MKTIKDKTQKTISKKENTKVDSKLDEIKIVKILSGKYDETNRR